MTKKRSENKVLRHEIEKQEVIKEFPRRGTTCWETVRLSRIKYFDNEDTVIDLRIFHRGYKDRFSPYEKEIYFPTTKGVQIKEELFRELAEYYLDKI